MHVYGHCDTAFLAVRDAFVRNFTEHQEIGASVCIRINDIVVVDLWGGFSTLDRRVPWDEDQLVNVFSIGKGVTSVIAAQCVADGYFTYDTKVSDVWPEFGCEGKESLTVRDVLGHKAGLPAVRHRLSPLQMYDWDAMCAALANEKPWWQLNGQHGYHVNTFGFLIGEVIRRTTGKSVGQHVQQSVASPLDADIYMAVPEQIHHRIAEFEWPGEPPAEEEPDGVSPEQLLQFNTYYNPSGLSGSGVVNTEAWRNAEIPSTNTHASARGVAQMYSALLRENSITAPRLLPEEVLKEATSEISIGDDIVLGRRSRFARGFQIHLPERNFGPNPKAFGHFGAGGSVGFADPVSGVGFGYVMNQMGPRWQNPRNQGLMDALFACL